jgi:hypothetical protein
MIWLIREQAAFAIGGAGLVERVSQIGKGLALLSFIVRVSDWSAAVAAATSMGFKTKPDLRGRSRGRSSTENAAGSATARFATLILITSQLKSNAMLSHPPEPSPSAWLPSFGELAVIEQALC